MGTDSRKRAVGDKRVPLLPGTQLNVTNSQGGQIRYTVEEEIGRGGSSLVYAGYYTNNSGVRKPVRIKECYPFRLRIERKESGELAVESRDAAAYEKSRARMQEAFRISNELYGTGGLTNSISNILDLYKANNTVYMISTYLEGAVLAPELFDSLKDAVAVVKSVAETIRKIQERGYLYLDIKPENVFVLKNVTEMSVLFDFDSLVSLEQIGEEEGEDIRCTSGFAALEQRTGSVKHIGKHTDVYGVGALLFYLLFERTPNAFDCDMNVIYDYSYSKYASYSYRDKLYYTLTDFFHHTLSSAWQDRYPDLTEAVAKLEEIERLADLSKPFICDSYIPDKVFMTGREKEEKKLVQWLLDREKKCLFVTGMGGIGKSTLVRSCISRNRAAFDTILYLYYNGSLSEMIGDDRQLCVNTVERLEKENDGDYFKRKLHVLRKILSGTGTLLVIDNFSGKADEDFCAVLQAGWKVIFITRNEYRTVAKEYDSIKVEAIQDRDGLYELFAVNMGRTVREEDTVWLNLMISKLQGHTLAMELLAKQIAKSYLTVREAAELAGKHGFAAMAPEKVGYVKDGRQYFENISGIITDLFSVEQMSWKKKIFMRMLALFAMPGVEMKDFRQMLDVTSLDLLNELQEEGWLQIENRQSALLSLHPVIRETVRQWEWSEEYNEAALQVMQYLYVKLRIQGQKEVQPVKGQMHLQEEEQVPDNNAELNIDRLNDYLRLSENVLDSLPRDRVLNDTAQYQNLLYYTIFNMPRDREDFIMSRSEELLQSTQKRKSRGSDCNYEAIVMLYDYIIFLHCEKEEYEQAYAKMMRAKKMARSQHDHHLWGLYYSIQGQYYDELLNGAYVAWSKEQKEILRRMLKAANCSIRHMRKSGKETGGRFLAEYLLDKAVFLIRSHSAGSRKIKKLIDQAAFIMEKYGTENSKFGHAYYLSCAWYYTLLVPDENLATQALLQSCEISEKRNLPELDRIDFVIVPCADIALEWGMGELAAKWLESCIRCCDQYSESLPYIRKKMELYLHLLDVHCCRKDFDRCGIVIEIIDRENEENKWAGIEVTIPEEIRKAVALRESDWW